MIIEQFIGALTGQILGGLIKSPQIPVQREDIPVLRPEVRDAVEDAMKKELQPRLEHLTNNEPAIQSRVTQGSVGAMIVAICTLLIMGYTGTLTIEALFAQGAIIVGTAWALYGRWVARKPVGQGSLLGQMWGRNGAA